MRLAGLGPNIFYIDMYRYICIYTYIYIYMYVCAYPYVPMIPYTPPKGPNSAVRGPSGMVLRQGLGLKGFRVFCVGV